MKNLVLFIVLLALLPACPGSSSGDDDTGTGSNSGSETDTGTTDTGSDSDGDTDADTDTDTGTDTDSLDCDGGRYDSATGLCWQNRSIGSYEWQEAIDYCDGLDLGGHTDWYLPSRDDFIELLGGCQSEVIGGGTGYCDTCAASATCSALFDMDVDWYWSSSSVNASYAWFVNFNFGSVRYYYKTENTYARCVRSGP
ncbi:MAG: DUF1566 domain-containing protein [Deltaproteobacteria bacterium]|nr:DUF1566 domain-containing protein [Deltaproteobacteria bacterium]